MCGTIFSNDATLSSGTMITVPDNVAGSILAISRVSATTDAYSEPCAPDTNATTLPGFAPCTTATPTDVPASEFGGTTISPYASFPRAAVAVPTEIVGWGSCVAVCPA